MSEIETAAETKVLTAKEKYPVLHRMVTQLAIETDLGERDYDVESIMETILSGETAEEIFANQELGSIASQDYLGKPFYLKKEGITWMKSTLESGAFPFFAMIRVRDLETDEEVTINGGGTSFVSVLWKLADVGWLDDEKALILEGKQTGRGFTVVLVKPYALPKSQKK